MSTPSAMSNIDDNTALLFPEEDNMPFETENTNYHTNLGFEESNIADQTNSSSSPEQNTKTEQENHPTIPDADPISFFSLFQLASCSDGFLIFLGVLASSAAGFIFPIMLIIYGDLTDSFVAGGLDPDTLRNITCNKSVPSNTTTDLDPDKLIQDINRFGILVSSLGGIFFILGFIFVTSFNYTAEKQVYRIRSEFLKSILRQDIGWHDKRTSNDFASRITEDLNKIQDGIGEKLGMFIFSLTNCIVAIASAFYHGWELTLVTLAAMPIVMISSAVVSTIETSLTEKELAAYGKAGGVAEEAISSIRTVMAFGGEQKEIQHYQDELKWARKAGIKKGLISAIGAGLNWSSYFISYCLAFWYGTRLILNSCESDSGYSAGDLMIVFFSAFMGSMKIGQALPYIEAFSIARGAGASIFSVIKTKSTIKSSPEVGLVLSKVTGNILFDKVCFNYPSRPGVKILKNLSFEVVSGQTVALVGTSGCGKSTCIQLLLRLYDPLEGKVCIDGYDIRDLNIDWMRAQIGMVGQEPVLFGTTIGENIRYGWEGATQEEIEAAAKEANAHDFIIRLPLKYDTLVGERGAQLSGGQKQRIAIARALVRNPKILLLDEATSALDTQSEAVVQRALDKARLGRTTVIVAHRLTTIQNADRIIVIKEGIVEEEGSHDDLILKRGAYYELVSTQQQNSSMKAVPSLSDLQPEFDYDNVDNEAMLSTENENYEDDVSLSSNSPIITGGTNSSENFTQLQERKEGASFIDIIRMNGKEWYLLLLGIVGSTLVGVATPFYAIIFAELFGVLSPGGTEEDLIEKKALGDFYSLMLLIIGIVVGVAAFCQFFSFSVAGEMLTSRLRSLTFQAILKQEIGWFDQSSNNAGSLCAQLSGDAASVQGATGSRLGVIFQSLSTVIGAVILAFILEWRLALVAIPFGPFILLTFYLQSKLIMEQAAFEREGLQKSVNIATEAISNIRTVASLGKEDAFHGLFMDSLRLPHEKALRNSWIRGTVFGSVDGVILFSYAGTLYFGGWLIVNAGVDYVTVLKVSEALLFGTETIGNALSMAPNYHKAKVAANAILGLLRRKSSIDASSQEGTKLRGASGNVDFNQVEFQYPTRKNAKILQGLSLTVKSGQNVALVGHSGCGKSTCIQLLQRFYDPDAGQVKLDGQNIRSVDIASLRSHMGIVSQEPVLFNRTIGENIAYGDNSREVPMDEIIESARKANIHTFIQSLPNGYDTMVGMRGTQLSGGQKQRVAIARALVRNPKILLLDEATSALDSESERVVQSALDAAREGRTCITIAHRLSTIQNADNIIVLNRGVIQEQGTHEQLMRQNGFYYSLSSVEEIIKKE